MQNPKLRYEAPEILTFTEETVLDLLGPARTYATTERVPVEDPSAGGGGGSKGGQSGPRRR